MRQGSTVSQDCNLRVDNHVLLDIDLSVVYHNCVYIYSFQQIDHMS